MSTAKTHCTVAILLCLMSFAAPIGRVAGIEATHVDIGDAAMVVSDSAIASQIGRDMLAQGGSAVDAAVATAFALAVSWPDSGNIGGGGFMIVRPADGNEPVCVDYRETAPMAITTTSFTKEDTTYTQKAVGVPGTVRGLAAAHARYGKLPWDSVVMPAARLAAAGVSVDQALADSLNNVLAIEELHDDERYAEFRRVYDKPGGGIWEAGDRFFNPDLSKTLMSIAQQGPDAFYTGSIANLIVQEMQRGEGLISPDDLRGYSAKIRPAMQGTYRGYTVIGAPPPSSGGTCIIEALNILENFDLASRDRFDPVNLHLIVESLRRVFADRAKYLGDPDFVDVPAHLTSKEYAKELADDLDVRYATKSEELGPELELEEESPETTHFSVIDADGMAVSNTYTLEASWGSRIVVPGAGFVLNNEMGDFNWFPGETNREGGIGTDANLIQPGKRMLSSQSPTIVSKDGRVVLVTGSPGGRTIISTVLCVILNWLDFGLDAAESVAAPRMHHQWFPDMLQLENMTVPPHYDINGPIRRMRHLVEGRGPQGSAHSIMVDPETGKRFGVSDFRRGGRPAGLSSGTLGLWEFADPKGTELADAKPIGDHIWSSNIAGSQTDGRGHLHIRRDSPMQPMHSYLDLSNEGLSRIAVEIKIESAMFAGKKSNEQLRMTLTHGTIIPRVTARMVFGRIEEHKIMVRGEASGNGGSPILPVAVADKRFLSGPIVLRLEVDTEADNYRIGTRKASEVDFTYIGTGKLAPDREVNYFGINPLNDYASEDEHIDIDRIEVLRE